MLNLANSEKIFDIGFLIICYFDPYGFDFRILPRTILRYEIMTILDIFVNYIEIEQALICKKNQILTFNLSRIFEIA